MIKFLKRLFCRCKHVEVTAQSTILATSICKRCGKKRLHNLAQGTCLVLNDREYEQTKKDVEFLRDL